ncbi:MAG: hypothetical protein M1835_005848 [Candelina submexicana]|nr:MAG: hypothetical protein M1835_005848 [Candelina submexicana]
MTDPSSPGSTQSPFPFSQGKPCFERTSGGTGGSQTANSRCHGRSTSRNRTASHSIERPVSTDELTSFDLKAPPPPQKEKTIEGLAERLFSEDHLRLILGDQAQYIRFTNYLNRWKPQSVPTLIRYLETQKAIKAVEYANAIADTLRPLPGEYVKTPCAAAIVDNRFEARSRKALNELVVEALPAYITHCLVKIVTESLVKQITGIETPLMRELIYGLAEVFCLSDPSLKDNPIVYASEEFYRTTQYGKDYVIGRNCRFLQGPKSDKYSAARLTQATAQGHQICETVLNYRRDGSPFLNLLLIAPLYDNKGAVRYFIGAQIEVTGLVEDGRGLVTLERLLEKDRQIGIASSEDSVSRVTKSLQDLSLMFSHDEADIVKQHSRGENSGTNTPARGGRMYRPLRRVLGDENLNDGTHQWMSTSLAGSGRLPGVYQNYLLVRPFPSLRITFVSPALRIPGLLQTKLLDKIGGPSHVRNGIYEAMSQGVSVTARITWLPCNSNTEEGKQRWISCTPLFGADDRAGVWMVVMVEDERISGGINRGGSIRGAGEMWPTPPQSPGFMNQQKGGAAASSGTKLYSDYLRSQGDGRNVREARYVGGRSRPPSSQAGGSLDGEDAFRMNTTKPLDFDGLG